MNRIILAYCHDNAELAETVERHLNRIGIPFEYITDEADEAAGGFNRRVADTDDPVVLFITDNFFKSRTCMGGALGTVQRLLREQRLLTVVADGKLSRDGGATFEYVETHFDRMVYALQYMNYWQSAWLELSDRRQHADEEEKAALEEELGATRNIANEIGELISVLREAGYVTWEQFVADDYAVFFTQFGLQEWHEQYRRIAGALAVQEMIPPLRQAVSEAAVAEIPVVTGPLIPEPELVEQPFEAEKDMTFGSPSTPDREFWEEDDEAVKPGEEPEPTGGTPTAAGDAIENMPDNQWNATGEEKTATPAPVEIPEGPAAHHPAGNGQFKGMDELMREMEADEKETPVADFSATDIELHETTPVFSGDTAMESPNDDEARIEQAIRDAWFWLEKGHVERGLELLRFTVEQYPENERIRAEYEAAHRRFALGSEAEQADEAPESQPESEALSTNEVKSYDLMGDMAAEKGDYLFAKYCWDRAAELDPDHPGVYRKLGLMTSEHLRDYRETAVHYLKKALEHNPDDAEVHLALAGSILQHDDPAQAEAHYAQAILLDPALRTPDNDRLFRPQTPESEVVEKMPEPPPSRAESEAAAAPQPLPEKREVLTVLVTGATSGIGLATAEIFARQGHRVILTGRRIERLVLLKTQFEEEYRADVLMLPFDVREQGTVQAALDNLPETWQNIDILINNAGLAKGLAPIHEGSLEHWETMIDTNLKGLLYVTRAVAPGMVRRRRGHIINIGSSAGKEVYASGNVYCATKFAVDALTRAMRLDLHAYNIRVGQVSPGHVEETEFAVNRFDGDTERARIYDDFQPLRPNDVAEVIYFMVTRPPHVNIQDVWMFGTQQASATVIDRSGRG